MARRWLTNSRPIRRYAAAGWILLILLCGTMAVTSFIDVFIAPRLSPKERAQTASVIALTKYQESGSTLRCVIVEILKQQPNITFGYKVGDEFPQGNQRKQENTDYGDGAILFFAGSPPRFEAAATYRGDRIIGMDDLPIADFRQIFNANPKAP